MPHVFISYVEEDRKIAIQISDGLESAGIKTWYYSRDSKGGDYLENIATALEDSQAMIVIISPKALEKSNQVNIEVVRAHEKRKIFQPVLVDVTWDDLEEKQKKWRLVMASAIGITWDDEHKAEILDEIVKAMPIKKDDSSTPAPPPPIPVPVPHPGQSIPVPPPIPELFASSGALHLDRFEPILGQAFTSLPQEVQLVGHDLIGTPHIFNVLLGIPGGLTQHAVASQSIDPFELRLALRNSIRRGDQQVSEAVPPLVYDAFSPNGLASLESAERIARQQGRVVISEADLLLAIVNNKQSVTVRMLNQLDNLAEKIQASLEPGEAQLEHSLNLADETRQILSTALSEAYTSGFRTIETPHFITAITRLPGSKIAQALQTQGIPLETLRNAMLELMPPVGSLVQGPQELSWEVYSSRMQEMLMLAEVDALTSGTGVIHETHLVSALSKVQTSLTVEFLRWMGVDFDQLLRDTAAMSAKTAAGDASPPSAEQAATRQEPLAGTAPPPNIGTGLQGSGLPSSALPSSGQYSRQVIGLLKEAQAQAFQYGYKRVETPFLLMALCLQADGCLGRGLQAQSFDNQSVLTALRASMRPAAAPLASQPVEIADFHHERLSPRIQNILKIAEEEARTNNSPLKECHLLTGFLRSQGGQTTAFLESLGVDLPALLDFAVHDTD